MLLMLLALINTACTMSTHSTAWRAGFCKHLPDGKQCYKADKMKRFHFAGGGETPEPCHEWIIHISFDGRDGEVHSAEVPTGTTPLLLPSRFIVGSLGCGGTHQGHDDGFASYEASAEAY